MAEFEEKLNAILGDPEAMGQIVSIAKALTGESAPSASPPQDATSAYEPVEPLESSTPSPTTASSAAGKQTDWSALLNLVSNLSGNGSSADSNPLSALGDLDPALVQKGLRLFSEYSATDDRKIALLTALKPFLKEERLSKVDKAVQIAKLSRVIRVAFQLFKKEGTGDGSV